MYRGKREYLSQAFYKNVLLKSKDEQEIKERYKTSPLSIYDLGLE